MNSLRQIKFNWQTITHKHKKTTKLIVLCIYTIIAIQLISNINYPAMSSLEWMNVYYHQDFVGRSLTDLLEFIKNWRLGIAPSIGLIEIINLALTGNNELVTMGLYRLGLFVAFGLPIAIFTRSVWQIVIAFIMSTVFLAGTIEIHPGNPQIYDIYYSLFFMLYLSFLYLACRSLSNRYKIACAILAGVFLSLTELTRPFILLFLPFLLLQAYFLLRQHRRLFIYLCIPLALFSGTWHAKLLIFNDGQLFWSNHSGFNLFQAWGRLTGPFDLADEPIVIDPIIKNPETHWPNINTAIHYQNSQFLQNRVIDFIISNIDKSVDNVMEQTFELAFPKTSIYSHIPESGIIFFYKNAVRICFLVLTINLFSIIYLVFRHPTQILKEWTTANIFIVIGTFLVLAIGENGEEARFLISILPLMAATSWVLYPPTIRLRPSDDIPL